MQCRRTTLVLRHRLRNALDDLATRYDLLAHAGHLTRVLAVTIVSDLRADAADYAIATLARWSTPGRGKREEVAERRSGDDKMLAAWVWQNSRISLHLDIEVRA